MGGLGNGMSIEGFVRLFIITLLTLLNRFGVGLGFWGRGSERKAEGEGDRLRVMRSWRLENSDALLTFFL